MKFDEEKTQVIITRLLEEADVLRGRIKFGDDIVQVISHLNSFRVESNH